MYEPVIGLEVHLHLKTRSKMFCSCAAEYFGDAPNTHTCPICLGLPGVLPTINRQAVEYGIMFALALNCRVAEWTQFHRKNYYYPDLPKNYQISQYDRPLGTNGWIEVGGERVRIKRVHLEEDAGKSTHPAGADYSLIDLNRTGAPLIEMVTEPDLTSPEQARRFLNHIRSIAQTLGISDANPEEGKMRADVNVSVRPKGQELGTKVEIKNLNSFRSVQRALEYEIKRQTRILKGGGAVKPATLGWDEAAGRTYLMRTKEAEADYRYFPEPDLPPLRITREWLEQVRARMPELPARKMARYIQAGVRPYDAEILAYSPSLSAFFDRALETGVEAQKLANWLNADVAGYLNERGLEIHQTGLTPEHLARLVRLVEAGTITGRVAKQLLPEVMEGADPERLVEERGLKAVTDETALRTLVEEVIAANPQAVASIRSGKLQAINALLGQVMRKTRGTAPPEVVRRLLAQALEVDA
ncbi:Asp-tRNA(Asn)/Glu-tRNA(Gln) amidotransferase subunit GatB [Marinithermus hydrothermalis]|uniref:Aspartyl/glutamyl-tRNA(Asn/Gln) amidotransferase subunit B n=1 Tax=Marinithermus hydrothermalis (strain DSM 14884 / JCM 11576 / T1) TaxID=869210 RepID=F2NR82_MARHT|nr:Asp-tRNA(Asn)/Glu-tRNA(Gln) amidotransferase subunit GatB [Marinithermus hydrothermalis]AEB12931.1 Aspartyl/glutamyl-tRNA(Asn/Gln) amidotransferase subunit B [Marinithermus hydrothermalis DSM 14884]